MYVFKDEYRIGIDSIDEEHQKLFEIADRAYEVMMDEFIPDKYDYIIDILGSLKEYAATHFEHEEEYMVSIGYKKLFTQKIAHQAFIERLQEYDLNEIDENQRETILELLEFLNDWLINHILYSDKQIGK